LVFRFKLFRGGRHWFARAVEGDDNGLPQRSAIKQ